MKRIEAEDVMSLPPDELEKKLQSEHDDYIEVAGVFNRAESALKLVRQNIETLLTFYNNKIHFSEGTWILSKPSGGMTWDDDKLSELIYSLQATHPDIAEEIKQCKTKEWSRRGGLMFRTRGEEKQ